MQFAKAPDQYDQADQAQMRGTIERDSKTNLKQGTVFTEILVRDTVTGVVKTVTIASGAWVIT